MSVQARLLALSKRRLRAQNLGRKSNISSEETNVGGLDEEEDDLGELVVDISELERTPAPTITVDDAAKLLKVEDSDLKWWRPIPRKLRRRTTSHNRYAHSKRRRKRERVSKALNTHRWHAKRMVMINRWGYTLPMRPNDVGQAYLLRKCYSGCCAVDMSYCECFVLQCPSQELLRAAISRFIPPFQKEMLDDVFIKSKRRDFYFHRCDAYPMQFLAPCSMMMDSTSSGQAALLIWIHPGASRVSRTIVPTGKD